MLGHEIVGIFTTILIAAVVVSALSRQADTANVIGTTFGSFKDIVDATTAPVRGG